MDHQFYNSKYKSPVIVRIQTACGFVKINYVGCLVTANFLFQERETKSRCVMYSTYKSVIYILKWFLFQSKGVYTPLLSHRNALLILNKMVKSLKKKKKISQHRKHLLCLVSRRDKPSLAQHSILIPAYMVIHTFSLFTLSDFVFLFHFNLAPTAKTTTNTHTSLQRRC
jgi:hypothetical protein